MDNSDKYNFKNLKLHLSTCKNVRRSYIFYVNHFGNNNNMYILSREVYNNCNNCKKLHY
jgi:hypothetical protein